MTRTTRRATRRGTGAHDHTRCVQAALAAAARVCEKRELKLTPIRRKVLEIVWSQHEPIGAYDILKQVESPSGKAVPTTVYRALEFLIDAGLVHRIDSLNAFKGCDSPEHAHRAQFLVCRACRRVEELDDDAIESAIDARARRDGFDLHAASLEIRGLCGNCADKG